MESTNSNILSVFPNALFIYIRTFFVCFPDCDTLFVIREEFL